jgi:hypothetical protein
MCDMIPGSEHWRLTLAEGQAPQEEIMGYLPGFATPRMVCDVPYVGKRWVHQVARYDTDHCPVVKLSLSARLVSRCRRSSVFKCVGSFSACAVRRPGRKFAACAGT